MSFMFLKPVNIDSSELSRIIGHKEDGPVFIQCKDALIVAAQHQQAASAGDDSYTGVTKLKRQLGQVETALNRIDRVLSDMGIESKFLDEHYLFANDQDPLLLNLRDGSDKCGFHQVIQNMRGAVDSQLDDLITAGSGNTKNTKYTFALAELQKSFAKIFPDRNISSEPDSLFHQLVIYWLHCCVGDTSIKDARRHIENMLEATRTE